MPPGAMSRAPPLFQAAIIFAAITLTFDASLDDYDYFV